jgi:hypothetical protein
MPMFITLIASHAAFAVGLLAIIPVVSAGMALERISSAIWSSVMSSILSVTGSHRPLACSITRINAAQS